jgi:ABC-type lipopolysaccharide export system ATPase subunit
MPLVECIGLVKECGDKLALDNVHLRVEEGEIVVLVGPEGSGKTTAYRLACGLLWRVSFKGVDVTDSTPEQRKGLGIRFFFEDASIDRTITIKDALLATARSLQADAHRGHSQVDELLMRFGFASRRLELIRNLSYGERMRFEIARCLIGRLSLFVLDEPFEALDLVTMHGIADILRDESKRGLSVLLTDNRGRESVRFADRSYVLHEGKVVVSDDAKTVLDDPIARRECFGDNHVSANAVVRWWTTFERGRP